MTIKKCKKHPKIVGGEICHIIEPDGMKFEVYYNGKLVESYWSTSEWDEPPFDDSLSIIRREKINNLLKYFEEIG